jgi:hypothetical protein
MTRDLASFLWACRLISPFATRAQIAAQTPRRIRWEAVIAGTSAHLIVPFLYPCLKEHGLLALPPSQARDALEEIHLINAERNRALAGQVESVSRTLNRAGIEPVWLKGAARLIEGSRWSTMRVVSDLDLWFPAPLLEHAMQALRAEGYEETADDPVVYLNHHHFHPLWRTGEPAMVEVHRGMVDVRRAQVLTGERMLGNARFFAWRGVRVGVPSMADQILNIVSQDDVHVNLHGLIKARRPLEFARLCQEHGVERSIQLVRDAYRDSGEAEVVEQYFALASVLFGLPGDFPARAAVQEFLLRVNRFLFHVRFPRLETLWTQAEEGRRYWARHPSMRTRKRLKNIARRTWSAWSRSRGERWQ